MPVMGYERSVRSVPVSFGVILGFGEPQADQPAFDLVKGAPGLKKKDLGSTFFFQPISVD